MRWTRKGTRIALGVVAASMVLGVGTVAAQSSEPWWTEYDIADSADVVTMDGSVAVNLNQATGSLRKARENFPDTGEFIGCVITTAPDDGQFITCAARDADGEELRCDSGFGTGANDYTRREQAAILAAASIDENSFIGFGTDGPDDECFFITVSNSSVDFLANEGGGTGGVGECDQDNSVNLGAFGSFPRSVPNDGCATVVQFAQPWWNYGPGRTMQLQNPGGTTQYPVDYEYAQQCTGASGAGTFESEWDDQYLPGLSDECPLYIKLLGDGGGTISLKYY